MNASNSNESDLFRLLTDCKWDEVLFQIDRDPSGASELMDTGKRLVTMKNRPARCYFTLSQILY